eukprot:TRINITY_DN11690_c0_g1_i1.p1 TRINITY_DN11690_c0_g1~~TRINITY_DN11690_c0_g1_i1.p1  ORF type:complete len:222 (+),score=18.44 TRINITY_DN11690_c0_g1_i1:51-668(+)
MANQIHPLCVNGNVTFKCETLDDGMQRRLRISHFRGRSVGLRDIVETFAVKANPGTWSRDDCEAIRSLNAVRSGEGVAFFHKRQQFLIFIQFGQRLCVGSCELVDPVGLDRLVTMVTSDPLDGSRIAWVIRTMDEIMNPFAGLTGKQKFAELHRLAGHRAISGGESVIYRTASSNSEDGSQSSHKREAAPADDDLMPPPTRRARV